MGTLFPNDPEYPDFRPMPPCTEVALTVLVGGLIVTVLGSHMPMIHDGYAHVPHRDYVEDPRPSVIYDVSTMSSGDRVITPGTAHLGLNGFTPIIEVGPLSELG